ILLRVVHHIASKVGKIVETRLGEALGLTFDGWTCDTIHFFAMFAVYVKDGALHQSLLAAFPAEHGQTADAHVKMIDKRPRCLQQAPRHVAVPGWRQLLDEPSHRDSSWGAACWLRRPPLRLPNNTAKLGRHTYLKPLRANATSVHRRVVALLAELEELDSVCIQLQAEGVSLGRRSFPVRRSRGEVSCCGGAAPF
ncbi:hypothetical protein PybrP1_003870, partial [[Pythium] brassicae (nom. inval.)]